jgi:hypothetical protein
MSFNHAARKGGVVFCRGEEDEEEEEEEVEALGNWNL